MRAKSGNKWWRRELCVRLIALVGGESSGLSSHPDTSRLPPQLINHVWMPGDGTLGHLRNECLGHILASGPLDGILGSVTWRTHFNVPVTRRGAEVRCLVILCVEEADASGGWSSPPLVVIVVRHWARAWGARWA